MVKNRGQLTITLHWSLDGKAQQDDVMCDDSAPRDLIPTLVRGCQLPTHDAHGVEVAYELRHEGATRPALSLADLLSIQGVRTGSHLWLVSSARRSRTDGPSRCLLRLPDGSELVVPERGQTLTREWLLHLLGHLHPEEYQREMALLARNASCYRFVSNRDHCTIQFHARGGYWTVLTTLEDIATLLNNELLRPGIPERLDDGMRLMLGRNGVEILVTIV